MSGWAWLGILMFVASLILYRVWWSGVMKGKDFHDVEHRNNALRVMGEWTKKDSRS